jgi:membrane associated rhomboid family serine protease
MLTCIDCGQPLTRKKSEYGIFWACEGCDRWLLAIPLLRGLLETDFFSRFWQVLRQSGEGTGKPCPACSKPLNQLSLGSPEAPIEPLACKACNNAWFTPAERAALPIKPSLAATVTPKPLPSAAAQALAMMQVEMIAERAREENKFDHSRIPIWQKALCILGMPMELGDLESPPIPWATVLLSLAILAFSLNYLSGGTDKASELAFIPANAGRNGGLTFFLNFLVHAGWFNLASNLYFLFLFGRSVEGKFHWPGFGALFLFSNMAGNLAALCLAPQSHEALLGAGGGIAGILLFYGFVFPNKRLVFYFFRRYIPIPAWAFLGIWVLFQLLGALMQSSMAGGISYACNFGGLFAGLLAWLFWRWRQKGEGKTLK